MEITCRSAARHPAPHSTSGTERLAWLHDVLRDESPQGCVKVSRAGVPKALRRLTSSTKTSPSRALASQAKPELLIRR
ncbi:hypothetical protein AAFF_G00389660 [Aldrovandia affinis]|uniref:Uncharacterized protein n=1 Tax=Aldrovandia affinis TaxID=143900 RepID=A0AAD7WM13_9TELE|nr:hypothetical protein AAFF_G00389660 [Aldrovandia affinis]